MSKNNDVSSVSSAEKAQFEARNIENNAQALEEVEFSAEEERRLVRRIDWRLIPFLSLLYLVSFLDRVNIGQARLDGLERDLNLTSREYQICLTVFFATYVAFETVTNHLLKMYRPSIGIPIMMIAWSIVMTLMGIVQNYAGLLATRIFLGLAECGLFPGVVFFLTLWYRRREQTFRIAILFSGATLAGAFGGLLAWAIGFMGRVGDDGVGGLEGWRWIFILEGLATFLIGVAGIWLVHDFPAEARFLSERERTFVLDRLRKDQGVAASGEFTWSQVTAALKDYKTWVFSIMYFCAGSVLYSTSLFAPTIIAALGTWTRPQAQLLSVPPYVLAFICTVGAAIYSDRTGRRAIVNIITMSVASLGFIFLLAVPVRYSGPRLFAVFLCVAGVAPSISTTLAFAGGSFGPVYKRATAMGIIMSFGNCGGIVSSWSFPAADSPKYTMGHSICLSLCLLNVITSGIMWYTLSRENARRDAKFGKVEGETFGEGRAEEDAVALKRRLGLEHLSEQQIVELGDGHPQFRYLY